MSLSEIKIKVYDLCELDIYQLQFEPESQEYGACQFYINDKLIIYRDSKITPKKVGQFVTFWKRNQHGIIEPLHESYPLDFYVITARSEQRLGQFVFPKKALIREGIISTQTKDGKRGFRVYPSWDLPQSKQAKQTQKWQLNYFYEIGDSMDLQKVKDFYNDFWM